MSTSHRLSCAAAIGCLIAFWAEVGWADVALPPIEEDSKSSQGYTQQEKVRDTEGQFFPNPIFMPSEANKSKVYNDICNSPKDSTHADLCQQWRAAEAATEQAKYATPTFWITVASIILNFLAFVAVSLGLREAKTANDLSVKQFSIENRGWVLFANLEIVHVDRIINIYMNAKNFGNNLVRITSISNQHFYEKIGVQENIWLNDGRVTRKLKVIIPPNGTVKVGNVVVNMDDAKKVYADNFQIVCCINIEYEPTIGYYHGITDIQLAIKFTSDPGTAPSSKIGEIISIRDYGSRSSAT